MPTGTMTASRDSVSALLGQHSPLPSVIVFDLDKTVWDVFAAENTSPPYSRISPHEVSDSLGRRIRLTHQDIIPIFEALRIRGIRLAIASLSPAPDKVLARDVGAESRCFFACKWVR